MFILFYLIEKQLCLVEYIKLFELFTIITLSVNTPKKYFAFCFSGLVRLNCNIYYVVSPSAYNQRSLMISCYHVTKYIILIRFLEF